MLYSVHCIWFKCYRLPCSCLGMSTANIYKELLVSEVLKLLQALMILGILNILENKLSDLGIMRDSLETIFSSENKMHYLNFNQKKWNTYKRGTSKLLNYEKDRAGICKMQQLHATVQTPECVQTSSLSDISTDKLDQNMSHLYCLLTHRQKHESHTHTNGLFFFFLSRRESQNSEREKMCHYLTATLGSSSDSLRGSQSQW